ncbi:hypothetical protein OV450_7358 [Actinobacteria bacterium OV450]|nr:hypothetical protein OV450_7358 [Actinobacteria bacterium OV450]
MTWLSAAAAFVPYIEAFPSEEHAFHALARSRGRSPFSSTPPTPTAAATAARGLTELGRGPGCAIRLDSGDLGELARRCRSRLDAAARPMCGSSPVAAWTST